MEYKLSFVMLKCPVSTFTAEDVNLPVTRKECRTPSFYIENLLENGDEGDEAEEGALDDNKNKISQSPTRNGYHDKTSEAETTKSAEISDHQYLASTPIKKSITPEERVAAILREIQSATPDSTSDREKVGSPSVTSHSTHDKHRASKYEDPKIAEFLNRGDTAVIYPEPVSDGEDQQNGDEAGSEEEEIILKCMHCPQTFLRAIILRDHMREVHADKPLKFMCPKCDETFHQKSQLDKHLTLHSPTSQICTVCNKTFANVYRLQRHMISHNESTDLRKFKCPECGKAFKFKHHLKEHVRIHSGEKPFVCNNCGKRFSHSGSFSSHTTSKKCWGLSVTNRGRMGNESGAMQSMTQNVTQSSQQSMTGLTGQKLPSLYASSPLSQYPHPSSVPVSIHAQQNFIHNPFGQQKAIPPFYYPPQMFATPDGFLHPMYAAHLPAGLAMASLAGMKPNEQQRERGSNSPHPSISSMSSASRSGRSMSPHSQSTRSFSPHSHSGRSVSPASVFSMTSPPPTPSRRSSTPQVQPKRESITPAREPASSSPNTEQISPDVNSNTKILLNKENKDNDKSDESQKTGEESVEKLTDTSAGDIATKSVADSSKVESSSSLTENKKSDVLGCQHCGEVFESPVSLHQHERYLCKQNKDIVHHRSHSETCQSPHSTVSELSHVESTTNGSVDNASSDDDMEELYKDGDCSMDDKTMRIRTQFTEEQQNFLKSQYLINPRPRKFELIRMGNSIGFSKRVVQVWFQNMRARERKYGREPAFSLNHMRSRSESMEREKTKSPTYIPNVPKLFPHMMSVTSPVAMTTAATVPLVQPSRSTIAGETPLDLSVRKAPLAAHGGSVSRQTSPESSVDSEVLNLSIKKDSSEEREKSVTKDTESESKTVEKAPSTDKLFQDSQLYMYMQERMMVNKHFTNLVAMQNHLMQQTVANAEKMSMYKPSTELNIPRASKASSILFETNTSSNMSDSSSSNESSVQGSPSVYSSTMSHMPTSTTPLSLHSTGFPDATHSLAAHNLATLAEAAQQAAASILSSSDSPSKPKRMRKKTWRQKEAEEVQLDFEDSVSTDEDQPSKKKRKCWKNHRLDRDEGTYGCDLCNKVFSKQSSLARHKYEHSGARPFACDKCTKSFKHKHHLTEHKRLHSGEKPFQCRKCGKRFSHSGSFSQHMNHRYNFCSPNKTGDGEMDGDAEELSSQESP